MKPPASWFLVICIALSVEFGPQFRTARAGRVTQTVDDATGWTVIEIQQGQTTVKLVPAAGANVCSINVEGTEYLRTPPTIADLPGVGYGNPILYPTPNRVRGAQFTFENTVFRFPSNSAGNFIHGLVNRAHWKLVSTAVRDADVEVTMELPFAPGSEQHELFPRAHILRMMVRVSAANVRWTYEVDNTDGDRSVPFGFACHPYFAYQGQRAQTYLTVPATHLMESQRQLPSGTLLPLDGHRLDARKPVSLAGFVADDVYWGMDANRPTVVEFRGASKSIQLTTSESFTHLVVYTPERPFFCIENQTCSTDAHNLVARGMQDEAHLQVCPAGERMTGWVNYRFE